MTNDFLRSNSVLVEPEEFISMAMLETHMAVDTETNGKDIRDGRGYAIGISTAIRLDETYYSSYFPVAHTRDNVSDDLKEQLFQLIAAKTIMMHLAKFDLISLRTAGFKYQIKRWYCTLLMVHMCNENIPKGLDWVLKNALHEPGKNKPPEWELMFKIYGWSPDFPPEIMKLYAGEDAVGCYKIFEHLYPIFVKSGFDGQETTVQ